MIDAVSGLSTADLTRLDGLEQRVVAADGGRLKLEWRTLRSRPATGVHDLAIREGDSLIAFLGLYAFGGGLEIAGMVDPAHRRRGLGSALLARALAECASRGFGSVLLVVPRTTGAGEAFARSHGACHDHSEHALVLVGDPIAVTDDPALELRPAGPEDTTTLSQLLEAAFGHPFPAATSPPANTTVVCREGEIVGTLRVERDGPVAGVYGFAIDPRHQGCGIGRAVLGRVCAAARSAGVEQIGLEVAVENERALRLYTSLGFTPRVTEDYWWLRSGAPLGDG